MSMLLEFSVNKQIITRTDDNKVVENSKNYLYCKFSFSDEWETITKTAIFISAKGEVFNVILEDDACLIPWEVIKYPHFSISVFGGDLITANKVVIPVVKSGYAEGETPSEPTPDVYEQIIKMIKGLEGKVDYEVIKQAIEEYLQNNPIEIPDETDPTVPEWAKKPNKPTYTPAEIGTLSATEITEKITRTVDEQTKTIKTDVDGLQKQINEEAHFRGYLSTNAKIQSLAATPNDFAYSAESGTKWIYDEVNGWQDSGVTVPDQLTPASNTTPLINGEASAGKEEAYARGDHRHPTDTTRASVEELNNIKNTLENKADKPNFIHWSETELSFEFADNYNKIYEADTMTNISFSFAEGEYPYDYKSGLAFYSGETPTAIDYTGSGILNWVGVDCATVDGLSIFQPSASKFYDIVFYYIAGRFIGLVNGFVPATGNVVSE